ncbi:MAG TPA: TolC family protein [Anaeromyxobacteraceae bacterium]
MRGSGGAVLTLEDALTRARAHPLTAESQAQLAQASARTREAFAAFLPAGSVNAAASRSTTNQVHVPPESDATSASYSASVSVQVPIWDFGRTLGQVRAARASTSAAEADLSVTRQDVATQVRVAYFGALAAEALVMVADDTIVQMQKHLEFAKASFEVGRRTRFDVTRAEVDLSNARITKIQADNGVATTRAALSAAIGEPVGNARLEVRPQEEAPDPRPEEAVESALRARPELAALDLRLRAADASLASARSAWFPVLSATGQYGFAGQDPLVHNWLVGMTLSWPFLNGGADAARVAEQRGAVEQTQAAHAAEVLQVRADVEQAAFAVIEAHARRDASQVLVGQAQENLELAEGRYQAGVGSIVELTDAQAALTSARAQQVRAGYDLATARARLIRAIGEA